MVAQAAIHGLDGNPWATSAGFAVSPAEAQKLIAGFSSADGLYSGIFLGGTKYMFLRATDEEIQGKLGGDAGVTIMKSGKAIIIGCYGAGMTGGNCNSTVSKLADYLKSQGY